MELMLRCALPDRPGELARVATAIAAVGGDISAVDVVERRDEHVLDDLELSIDEDRVVTLLEDISALDGVTVVHAGPSRGHPGDAVTRLSIAIEALFDGVTEPRRGTCTLIGGMLRARSAELVAAPHVPNGDQCVLVLDAGGGDWLVLRRDYRFTATERERAQALLRLARRAVATGDDGVNRLRR